MTNITSFNSDHLTCENGVTVTIYSWFRCGKTAWFYADVTVDSSIAIWSKLWTFNNAQSQPANIFTTLLDVHGNGYLQILGTKCELGNKTSGVTLFRVSGSYCCYI